MGAQTMMKANHKPHNSIKQNVLHFFISAAIFFAVTMPFREFFALSAVTEIRPAAALPPFFGMIFGPYGALGCAAGNLAADLLSGYGMAMSLASFPVQFLMGLLPYILWYHIPVRGEDQPGFPRMEKVAHVIKYMLIILADALIISFLLGCILFAFGAGRIISQTTITMFWNNLDFSYILGLPLFSLAGWRRNHRLSLNEQLLLVFLGFSILAAILVAVLTGQAAGGNSEQRIDVWNHIYTDVAITLNIFIVGEILFLTKMEKNVTIPIQQLALAADEYVRKDSAVIDTKAFAHRCRPYASADNEVGHLAGSYVHMAENLETYMTHLTSVTAEKERIGAELDVAARIQANMLPSVFPPFPERKEFDIFAAMTPAKEVGGDFYDFFLTDKDHMALVMADVSGKGVPAALFMVNARTLIRNYAMWGKSPSEILSSVNEQLCEGNKEELFVTVWLAIVNLVTGEGTAANAGHEHPALARAGGRYELVKYRHSPAVAAMEGTRFREHEFVLYPGDSLFVYTDGVTEAANADEELFGEKRLLEALNGAGTPGATGKAAPGSSGGASVRRDKAGHTSDGRDPSQKSIVGNVRKAIDAFAGGTPQSDDITMMGFKYFGPDKGTDSSMDDLEPAGTDANTEGGAGRHDEVTLTAVPDNLERVTSFVEEHLEKCACPPRVRMQIGVAAEEIFVNIAHYAYAPGTGPVTIRMNAENSPETSGELSGASSVTIVFSDQGAEYNPLSKEDPDITLKADERPVGGLGIYMVRNIMDEVSYEFLNGCNVFTMRKTWEAGSGQADSGAVPASVGGENRYG